MNVLSQQFWTDKKVQNLGVTGKLLFAAMITDDRINLPGLYSVGCEHFYHPMLPAPVEDVQDAFKRILESGMAQFDPDHRVLRLPNVWKYAPAPTPNSIGSWKSSWLKTPDCSLRYDHLESLKLLAYKGNPASRAAYEAMFGQIIPGNYSSYMIGRDYLKEQAKARKEATHAGTRDPSGNLSNNNKMDILFLEGREAAPVEPGAQAGRDPRTKTTTATETTTTTKTTTGASRGHIEGIGMDSRGPRDSIERGSVRHRDGMPQVSDITQLRTPLALVNPLSPRAPVHGNAGIREDPDPESGYHTEEEDQ